MQVWRCGSPIKQSRPADKPIHKTTGTTVKVKYTRLADEKVKSLEDQCTASVKNREEARAKLTERDLVPTVSQSPFAESLDYIQGLNDQEVFLRPKSSHETS